MFPFVTGGVRIGSGNRSFPLRAVGGLLSSWLLLALSGCATPFLRPAVEVPAQFAASPASEVAPEVSWWEGFGDPVLSELVRHAAIENRDVRIAAERVRAARAGETISRSWLLPGIDGVGYSGTVRQGLPDVNASVAALAVSWEVDLAGRLRAGAAAAAADKIAAENAARGVRLLVLSDVATEYFTLVGALHQLEDVRAISAAQDETLRLVTARQRVGLASPFDVERARTQASSARAAIPPLETLAAVARHRIAVLIGDQAANARAVVPWSGALVVPDVQPGQPAALLERRPDLLESRARLDAANWRRQQAVAEWFPRLFVGALFGHQHVEEDNLNLESARFSNVAGLLTVPIVNWGRTRGINEMAESAQVEALLHYEDQIVRALEDVENALVALRGERQREDALQNAAAAADAALGHAQSLYDRGRTDLLPLLDAQRTRDAVRLSAIESNTRLLLSAVTLFKALGGGWESFEPNALPASASDARVPAARSVASTEKERR
jgi:multidrug efflux system outer membrane protein